MNNKKMTALLIAVVTFSAISAMIEDMVEETDEVTMPEMDYPTDETEDMSTEDMSAE